MAGQDTEQERIKKAEDRVMQAANRAQLLRLRAAERKRKEDARRKILVGATAIQLMRGDETLRARIRTALADHFAASPEDGELFAKVQFWETLTTRKSDDEEEEAALSALFEEKIAAPAQAKKAPSGTTPPARQLAKDDKSVSGSGARPNGGEHGASALGGSSS